MSIAAIGFEYGVMVAMLTLVQTKGDTKLAAVYGGVTTLATTAFVTTASLFLPVDKHTLCDESKYINERTEESN